MVASNAFVVAVVYRPGSEKMNAQFFDVFRALLSFAMPYSITGYLNVKFHRLGFLYIVARS